MRSLQDGWSRIVRENAAARLFVATLAQIPSPCSAASTVSMPFAMTTFCSAVSVLMPRWHAFSTALSGVPRSSTTTQHARSACRSLDDRLADDDTDVGEHSTISTMRGATPMPDSSVKMVISRRAWWLGHPSHGDTQAVTHTHTITRTQSHVRNHTHTITRTYHTITQSHNHTITQSHNHARTQ